MPSGGTVALSRAAWRADAPNTGKMNPMNGVSRVTIHHEGSAKGNFDESPQAVASTLRLIQKNHRARMGAGDIGYHYIIDRSGRVWQGREERYQGAHVAGNNANNLGVMLLGNFEIQKPTSMQLASLDSLTKQIMRGYHLRPNQLYCHCELKSTQCPGQGVRSVVPTLRARLA
jgi:N-acetyl-anhydromuramyl-L-alanine amidase AmpD